ncbi:MAG TPA: HEAT repeat domain-containing protein, partial [Limnochordia bacterium]
EALRRAGPRALFALVDALGTARGADRHRLIEAIALFGGRALPPLGHALSTGDPRQRRAVALALKRLALPESLPMLRRLLADPAERVRVYAAQAIGRLHTGAARATLLSAFPDARDTVSLAILRALAASPSPTVARALQRIDPASLSPAVRDGLEWAQAEVGRGLEAERRKQAPEPPASSVRPRQLDGAELFAPFGGALDSLSPLAYVGVTVRGTEPVAAALLRWRASGAAVLAAANGEVVFTLPPSERHRLLDLRAFASIWGILPHEAADADPIPPALVQPLQEFVRRKRLDAVAAPQASAGWGRRAAAQIGLRFSRGPGTRQSLRIRPAPPGWAAGVRLPEPVLLVELVSETDFPPLPYPGPTSLNRPLAACLSALTLPEPDDVVCDPFCGAGALLVERALLGPVRRLLGGDLDERLLRQAQANWRILAPIAPAAGPDALVVQPWDAASLPLADASVDAVATDLPFGGRSGSHAENVLGYPRWLGEIARVLKPGRRAVVLTREKRLLLDALAPGRLGPGAAWELVTEMTVHYSGVSPSVYVLQRKKSPSR